MRYNSPKFNVALTVHISSQKGIAFCPLSIYEVRSEEKNAIPVLKVGVLRGKVESVLHARRPQASIAHDANCIWNVQDGPCDKKETEQNNIVFANPSILDLDVSLADDGINIVKMSSDQARRIRKIASKLNRKYGLFNIHSLRPPLNADFPSGQHSKRHPYRNPIDYYV
jgi:hypothetical protein